MGQVISRFKSVIELAFPVIGRAGGAEELKPERRVLAYIGPKALREIAVSMPDPPEVESLILYLAQRENGGGAPVVGLFDIYLQGLFR